MLAVFKIITISAIRKIDIIKKARMTARAMWRASQLMPTRGLRH
jgi:hypothetical protein